MATYYVRPDGNDANTGLGSTTATAWATVTKAIGATGVGIGDTVYFAPGTYRGTYTAAFTNPANSGQRISFIGDPTATQFIGVTVGPVIWTNYISNTVTPSGSTMLECIKDFVTFENICMQGIGLDGPPHFGRAVVFDGQGHVLTNCSINQIAKAGAYGPLFGVTAGGQGPILTNCQFWSEILIFGRATATAWNSATSIKNCLFVRVASAANESEALLVSSETVGSLGGVTISDCTVISAIYGIQVYACSTSFPSTITNCYIRAGTIGLIGNTNNGQFVQTYNVITAPTSVSNMNTSVTTVTNPMSIIDSGYSRISGLNPLSTLSILTSTYGINAGINTYSPVTDMFGVTWSTPLTPTIGSVESVPYSTAGNYFPTERNASTITIAPGSTSQSIELYLGVTGLTASTSGLSARYNRTRTASQNIPLVPRTIDQSAPSTGVWTSGGFAEVDSVHMPGVYRLDIPNEALEAGADDVTVVVKGASGTNGAVMTIKLSSGGLTGAQTATAVWGASPAGYDNATTFGGVTMETNGLANGIEGEVQDVPSNVWQELRANHTTVGTFGAKLQDNVMADELLARELGSGSSAGAINERTVRSALRGLRNKTTVINSEMTVYKEDDASTAWSATVSSSDSSKTITGVDPS